MTWTRRYMPDRPTHLDVRYGRHIEAATPITPRSDPLGEALHHLRMDGAFYCLSELTAPWGFALMPMPGHLWFHVVTDGPAWLETPGGEETPLRPGELALVPHGDGHTLRSAPGVATPDILDLGLERVSDRYEHLRTGGGGEPTTLICGAVRFDDPVARNLMAMLPALVRVDAVQGTLALMAAEARELRPGGEAVITRLADILVIQAIRAWIETDSAARGGWLGALQDPQIGRALSLVHAEPGRPWSVASLASALAMSRSAFAARFTELMDEPAMQYVTRWRMQVARDELERGAGVAQVAGHLGYASEAAFARAFKRVTGTPPGAVRRAAA